MIVIVNIQKVQYCVIWHSWSQTFTLREKTKTKTMFDFHGWKKRTLLIKNELVLAITFGRTIWDKLPECIFENFINSGVKRWQFQNFLKSQG